ncbi:MAG: hypothetical protein ACREF6_03135, partial [Alphaproteobacteria bacterium]
PETQRNHILAQAFEVLLQDGVFVQYTYGPLSPVPRCITRSLALVKDRSAWVLRNVPPASVWRYSRANGRLAVGGVGIPAPAVSADAQQALQAMESIQAVE